MKRKAFALFLALTIVFAVTACSKTPDSDAPPADTVQDLPPTDTSDAAPETTDSDDDSYDPTPSDLRTADEMELVSPSSFYDPFEPTTELPEGAISIKLADRSSGASSYTSELVEHISGVVYDNKDGEELTLEILLPTGTGEGPYPLVMYVPGSAWMRQNVSIALPAMTRFAERGFAVAIVEYRGTDVAYFPATVEDAKTAIRFMRKNAEEYNISPERIAIWGDSSGGHTAVMVGVTTDGELDNGTYGEFSAEVSCVVDWYGPTDISLMGYYPSTMDHTLPTSPEGMLIGGVNVLENYELAQKANPLTYITSERAELIAPMLIMHGSADSIMPFNQSVRLFEQMRELGNAVMYKLEGAGHGYGGFNSDEALDIVAEYIRVYIG